MNLLSMQLRATMLILFVVLIRSLFLYKFPKKIFLAMWAVVVARLLIPHSQAVALGVPLPNPEELFRFLPRTPASADEPATISLYSIPWPLWCLWLAVCLGLAACFVAGHLRGRAVYRFALPVESEDVLVWKEKNKIRRTVRILECPEVPSALTYGVFRPVILLPKGGPFENREQLHFVLSHELEHIKHFDVVWKWISAAILCMNWYNPMVWVMHILWNRDIELHCDECVLKKFGMDKQRKSEYALALVALAEEKRGGLPLANHFSKSATEERILSILHSRCAPVLLIGAAVLAIAVMVFLAFAMFVIGEASAYTTFPL